MRVARSLELTRRTVCVPHARLMRYRELAARLIRHARRAVGDIVNHLHEMLGCVTIQTAIITALASCPLLLSFDLFGDADKILVIEAELVILVAGSLELICDRASDRTYWGGHRLSGVGNRMLRCDRRMSRAIWSRVIVIPRVVRGCLGLGACQIIHYWRPV